MRPLAVTRWGTLAAATMSAGLTAEMLWTAHRPLPSLTGLDASGPIGESGDDRPVRVVALGDSSLTGPGLAHADQIWLRQALHRISCDRAIELESLAVGGSRVADVRRRVDDAIALEPDLVVVAVGANDAIHGVPLRKIRAELERAVDALQREVPVVAVANVGDLGNIARVPVPLNVVLRKRSSAVCAVIEDVTACYERAVLLDVTPSNPTFRDRSIFAPDLFHPGELGHSAWADAALPGLQTALERLRT